jgi:transposase, IS5 family
MLRSASRKLLLRDRDGFSALPGGDRAGSRAGAGHRCQRQVQRSGNPGGAVRTRLRGRSRAAGTRARAIAAKLRLRTAAGRDKAQAAVRRITGELVGLAERAAAEAQHLLVNACRALRRVATDAAERLAAGSTDSADAAAGRRRGQLRRAVHDLTELLTATRRIAAQTRPRLSGITPDGATRRVTAPW